MGLSATGPQQGAVKQLAHQHSSQETLDMAWLDLWTGLIFAVTRGGCGQGQDVILYSVIAGDRGKANLSLNSREKNMLCRENMAALQ